MKYVYISSDHVPIASSALAAIHSLSLVSRSLSVADLLADGEYSVDSSLLQTEYEKCLQPLSFSPPNSAFYLNFSLSL